MFALGAGEWPRVKSTRSFVGSGLPNPAPTWGTALDGGPNHSSGLRGYHAQHTCINIQRCAHTHKYLYVISMHNNISSLSFKISFLIIFICFICMRSVHTYILGVL